MKKLTAILAVAMLVAAALPMTANAKLEPVKGGTATLEIDAANRKVKINGVEYNIEAAKRMLAEQVSLNKIKKPAIKGGYGVEMEFTGFSPNNKICNFPLPHPIGDPTPCSFSFAVMAYIADVEMPYYAIERSDQIIATAASKEKESYIDVTNFLLDMGYDRVSVNFSYIGVGMKEEFVTEYGKTSGIARLSPYWPELGNRYLFIPGNYNVNFTVTMESGNVYISDEIVDDMFHFTIQYNPMPDPLNMFAGVNVKEIEQMKADLIDVLGNRIKAKKGSFKVYNMQGREVYHGKDFSLESVANGVYVIKAQDGKQIQTRKVAKQ